MSTPDKASELTLRPAEPDDAPAIQAMIRALAETTGDLDRVTGSADDLRQHGFGDDRLFDCLLAERDHQPVGLCLYFFTYSSWLGEPGVYVQDIYIADDERGRGTGRRLMTEVATLARERNATHLRLSVDAENDGAAAFYRALGMQHRNEEQTYHLGGTAFTTLCDAPETRS